MSFETIQLEMRGAVCLLTLNRPERLNALTVAVGKEFQSAIGEARERGARAMVLTGAGRAFCAGGDLREMQEIAGVARLRRHIYVAATHWLETRCGIDVHGRYGERRAGMADGNDK